MNTNTPINPQPPSMTTPLKEEFNANSSVSTPTSLSATGETVYEFGRQLDSPTHVVSERVQTLASQIYTELQRIISRCNEDEDIVSGLMPLIVNVLESLDLALIENQQFQVELELCKDDNEQLVTAFEKEKTNKKKIEQRLFEIEFTSDEEKQKDQQQIDSLANIVKMLELKAKTSADHASRLEDKENELKKEYNKLHDRYNEILRSHCDLMERFKILIGNDENLASLGTNAVKSTMVKRSDFESSTEENEVEIIPQKKEIITPSLPRQAWIDTEMTYEDASIIEDVEEIPRDRSSSDRDKDKDCQSLTVADNFFGMEKEIENLITENNELLATKNALNIVKDDLIIKVDELQSEVTMCREEIQQRDAVKDRLKTRIGQLEEELKKTKEELEEAQQKLSAQKEDDEEGIPIAQRKRFTRVEMARVLMERNQYKEKLMELQEAIRWSEFMRANKGGEKKSLWKFFSNFFSPSSALPQKESPVRTASSGQEAVKFNPSNSSVTPALDAMRKRARQHQNTGGNDLCLFMDSDLGSERARALRSVRAHVNRSGNGDRIQAYGWSIAGSTSTGVSGSTSVGSSLTKGTSVPVPIYCRPLSGDDIGMKIWCAAAVDLSGGEAGFADGEKAEEKGDNISRGSQESAEKSSQNEIKSSGNSQLDMALADLESELNQALNEQNKESTSESQLSTFVWICSVSHSKSKVTIVNIRSNPGEVLDSFLVKTHLLCISSVPGAKNNDIQSSDGIEEKINEITLVKREITKSESALNETKTTATDKQPLEGTNESDEKPKSAEEPATEAVPKNPTLDKLTEYVAYTEPPSPSSPEEECTISASGILQAMSTCLPTMWLGGQNGVVYVYSSIAQWAQCIATVKLSDSILQIIHYRGRVFVALANGKLACFMRSPNTGEWDFNQYYLIDIGTVATGIQISELAKSSSGPIMTPQNTALYSIRCIEVSKGMLWLGYRNLIFILDAKSLNVVHSFTVHPRKETQVRQLTSLGDGVWCSLRLDSTLKLYSAIKPYQHLQDVDIEPYVGKMLSPKAFSFIRITSLRGSNNRLWVGTANGVILSLPCGSRENSTTIVSTNESGALSMSTFVPICHISSAQLSFHGHKDAVKFFVCTKNLVLSGGEGYIDFRLGGDEEVAMNIGERSHLIVWEISN